MKMKKQISLLAVALLLLSSFVADRAVAPAAAMAPAKGVAAKNFTLKDINGKMVSLSDFKGKFVVLDFWASWCKPCIEEMDATKKLIDGMKGNDDFVWLFVSFDRNEEHWHQAIDDKGIGDNVHLYAGGEAEKIKNAYNIGGIPQYVWINAEGEVVNKSAPRPSEFGTKARLKMAMK